LVAAAAAAVAAAAALRWLPCAAGAANNQILIASGLKNLPKHFYLNYLFFVESDNIVIKTWFAKEAILVRAKRINRVWGPLG